MKNNKDISLLAISTSLMISIGYVFELLIQWPFLGTYVIPNPAEGILIFIIMIFGLKMAITSFALYFIILFSMKGLSPTLINEIALISSVMLIVLLFNFTYKKKKYHFLKAAFITTLINSIVMTILNAYFITPTFIKNSWTTYQNAFPGIKFIEVIGGIIMPPSGILHGNIIKYSLCFMLATLANKTYIKIK